mgnify:CR=1 FL=1
MIEFAILFGLGFLTASLLALLLAPVVLRRVVWFTEKRLHATLPVSPQEVRAQKDMARALYAAENAKISQSLKQESEKAIAMQMRGETLSQEIIRLQTEKTDLTTHIEALNEETAELRSKLHREEDALLQLRLRFSDLENVVVGRDQEIETLEKRATRLMSDADNMKLELAASDTTAESMQTRIIALRDERDQLRQELKAVTQKARDAQMRLEKEEHRAHRIGEQLQREQMLNADREILLERRGEENSRLRDKLKTANRQTHDTSENLRLAGLGAMVTDEGALAEPPPENVDMEAPAADEITPDSIPALTEAVRHRSAIIANRLARTKTSAEDAELREEIAAVAARMVALTAMKEGETSPIPSLLSGTAPNGHHTLAARIAEAMNRPN